MTIGLPQNAVSDGLSNVMSLIESVLSTFFSGTRFVRASFRGDVSLGCSPRTLLTALYQISSTHAVVSERVIDVQEGHHLIVTGWRC